MSAVTTDLLLEIQTELSSYMDLLGAKQVRNAYRFLAQHFLECPCRTWGPPSLLYNGYRAFPGGKERPGRDAVPSPTSSAVVMKG